MSVMSVLAGGHVAKVTRPRSIKVEALHVPLTKSPDTNTKSDIRNCIQVCLTF